MGEAAMSDVLLWFSKLDDETPLPLQRGASGEAAPLALLDDLQIVCASLGIDPLDIDLDALTAVVSEDVSMRLGFALHPTPIHDTWEAFGLEGAGPILHVRPSEIATIARYLRARAELDDPAIVDEMLGQYRSHMSTGQVGNVLH
jgi:hypothetical protein